MSDIQDYIEYIIKNTKHTNPSNPSIHIYVNRMNKRLVFKINDGLKQESQTPETI